MQKFQKKTNEKDSHDKFLNIGDNIGIYNNRNRYNNSRVNYDKYQNVTKTSKHRNEMGDYRGDRDEDIEDMLKTYSSRDYYSNDDYKTSSYENHLKADSNIAKQKEEETTKYNELPNLNIDYCKAFEQNYDINRRKLPQSANPGIHDLGILPGEKIAILLNQTRPNFNPKSIEKIYRNGDDKNFKNVLDEKYCKYGLPLENHYSKKESSCHRSKNSKQNLSRSSHYSMNTNSNIIENEDLKNIQLHRQQQQYKLEQEKCEQNRKMLEKPTEFVFKNNNYKSNMESNNNLDENDSIVHSMGNDSKADSRKTVIEIESATRSATSNMTESSKKSRKNLAELEHNKVNVFKAIEQGIEKLNSSRFDTRNITNRTNEEAINNSSLNHLHNDKYILSSLLLKQNQQNERLHHYDIIKREIERLEKIEQESMLK